MTPIGIKANQTINTNFFDELKYWNEISKTNPKDNFIIYGGVDSQKWNIGHVLGWQSLAKVFGK